MKIYIYTLEHPLTGEIRYIGRTKNPLSYRLSNHCCKSLSNHGTHKKHWINKLKKEGLKPVIKLVEELNCTWEESHEIEQYWIQQFTVWGFNLVNASDKGFGGLEKPYYPYCSLSTQNRTGGIKSVLQYTKEGKFVKEWNSAREASIEEGFSWKNISACCKGEKKSHKGYMWKFKGDTNVFSNIEPIEYKETSKSVNQYTRDGVLVKEWNTVREAAQFFKCPNTRITSVCGGFWPTYANYIWRYRD